MAELVDAQDLGSCAARCGGSSPPSRTTQAKIIYFVWYSIVGESIEGGGTSSVKAKSRYRWPSDTC